MKAYSLKNWLFLLLLPVFFPGQAFAWWNSDWAHREKITVDVPADVKQPLNQFVVPIRLHTANFVFTDSKEDGSDVRFIADDDKTPLKFHIEKFDSVNELAVLWVQIPNLTPGATKSTFWIYYGNPKAPSADDPKGTYDKNQTVVLHFNEKEGLPKDATAYVNNPLQSTAMLNASGPVGPAATFNGVSKIVIPATPSLKLDPNSGFTFSAWVRITEPQANTVIFNQQDGAGAITIAIDGTNLYAQAGAGNPPAETSHTAQLALGSWHYLAVTIKDRLILYLDGKEAAEAPVALPALGGDLVIGGTNVREAGFKGDLDEVELANVARSADWVAAAHAGQIAEGSLLTVGEAEDNDSGGTSYFVIILRSVTVDGWVVISILMVMLVIAIWVMIDKAIFVSRISKANDTFRDDFSRLTGELTSIDYGDPNVESIKSDESVVVRQTSNPLIALIRSVLKRDSTSGEEENKAGGIDSSLYRIYRLGVVELHQRFEASHSRGETRSLSGPAIDAIKATVDAGLVREMQRLNSKMVLLTIAISGGPFLGLLGTVVGVMITFAAIAAIGDVNVNAIAPGIAAALVATVAGLSVAIPSLFGYNYLSSRISNIGADMQVFVDEFITKLAERYASES